MLHISGDSTKNSTQPEWLKQFDYDEEIKGDIEVKARGTESLMRNEVRSQRLIQLMQIGSSPTLAPFIASPV